MKRIAERPDDGVRVSALGQMYASCNAYGCVRSVGRVIKIGVTEIRLCTEHLAELKAGLK